MTLPTDSPNETNASIGPARLKRMQRRAESQTAASPEATAAMLEARLATAPTHVGTLLELAELRLLQGQNKPARELVARAVEGNLDSPKVALHLLRLLSQLSESAMILQIVRQLPPPMWDSAKSLAEVAQELSLIGAHELARVYARAGVARDPNHPPSLYMLATVEVFYGNLDSAEKHVSRVLEIVPEDFGSHWLMSRMRLPNAEQRVARIERLLQTAPTGEAEAWLAYALHNELHDLRDYAGAWRALERGCRAKRRLLGYSPEASEALFDALTQWSSDEIRSGDGFVDPGLTPIFVIGLHRSGTTLAERFLSGHSAISAGGETYDIRAHLRRATGMHYSGELDISLVTQRHAMDYQKIGRGYLQGMAWRANGRSMVTDKLPTNYYNAGFIARALPKARFINLRRDPIDVGLSSLRTLFSHACPYSYDQHEFVAHERNYQRLLEHWRSVMPERILDVDYQNLVDQPEVEAARMAAFCGLEFEPSMVRIESRSDAVSTASSVMMRDGIRRDRGKVWRAYEQQLQPMLNAYASNP